MFSKLARLKLNITKLLTTIVIHTYIHALLTSSLPMGNICEIT